MSRTVKLGLYIVCVIGVIVFGVLMRSSYRQATKTTEQRKERINRAASIENTNVAPATNVSDTTNFAELTNAIGAATNSTSTNVAAAADTNSTQSPTNGAE